MSPLVVLVGPPGAGKTTVGRLLAARSTVELRDTDHDVELQTGCSISDIFVERGEAAFRQLEQAAVRAALAEHAGVVALGGGAVLSAETRELLVGHRVVFLDVGLAAAADRVGLNRSRPPLAINPRAELTRMIAERRPLYEEVTTNVVVTDDRSPDEVADAVDVVLVPS